MHIEIDGVEAERAVALTSAVRDVLADVHHAVEDAPEMYRLIRALADQLTADPGEFDRETSEEAGELLRWLADGNYMILGHAAYSANELASPTARSRGRRTHRACCAAARASRRWNCCRRSAAARRW